VSDAGGFIDAALQYEVSPYVYPNGDGGLRRYGTSIGAIRGTVRDALKRFPALSHDELMALSSELWGVPVYERRLAAVVLLQARVGELRAKDLTRVEGFIRSADSDALVQQLVIDVLIPMFTGMEATSANRTMQVLKRWADESDPALRAASLAVSRSRS
jgi:hypothetical protein